MLTNRPSLTRDFKGRKGTYKIDSFPNYYTQKYPNCMGVSGRGGVKHQLPHMILRAKLYIQKYVKTYIRTPPHESELRGEMLKFYTFFTVFMQSQPSFLSAETPL